MAFIDRLCQQHDKQIVVLIPVVLPDRLRYEFLHNHYDLVLSAALRGHPDVVCARVSMPLEPGRWRGPSRLPVTRNAARPGGRLGSAVD